MTRSKPAPEGFDNMLDVIEVATLLSVSKMTIYRLIHQGEMPAIRVGRSMRIPERAVREYMQEAIVEPNGI
jgi:excisionase family DNA binding protein